MESMLNGLSRGRKTLDTATDLRLETRPRGMGAAYDFEDFGTSLKPRLPKKNAYGDAKPGSQASSQCQTTTERTKKFKPAYPTPSLPKSQAKDSPSRSAASNRSNSATRSTSKQGTRVLPDVVNVSSGSDLSMDEMDLFSSQTGSDDPSSSQRPLAKQNKLKPGQKPKLGQNQEGKNAKERDGQESLKVYVDSNGRKHEYDLKFLPGKANSLAGLKFKKNKKEETPGSALLASSSSSLQPQVPILKENRSSQHSSWTDKGPSLTGQDWEKPIDLTLSPKRAETDDEHVSPLSGKSAKSNRRISPSPPRPRLPVASKKPATSKNVPEQGIRIGPPQGRPKARPTGRAAHNAAEDEQPRKASDGPSSSQTRGRPSLTRILDMMPVDTSSRPIETRMKRSSKTRDRSHSRSESPEYSFPRTIRKTGLAEFPTLSPTSSPPKTSAFPVISPLGVGGSKAQPKPTGKSSKGLASSSRLPSAFPMSFTTADHHKEESKSKTRVKPAKEKVKDKGKGKAKETPLFTDDDEIDPLTSDTERDHKKQERKRKIKPKAFPMSTQVLASIASSNIPSSSTLPSFGSPRPRKRGSQGGSEDERVSKKSRRERDALLESPSRFPFEDEGDSISLAPNVDPSTLCPYCDTPLPSSPSPLLFQILAATKKKSQRDPRPSNPLGLKAPLTTFIAACQRHRFESQILPEAEKKGWPKTIKWKEVGGRVLKMKSVLKALIEDPGDDVMSDASDEWEVIIGKGKRSSSKKKGPKARSIFWVEVMDDVKKKGLRAVSGVRGQFANFEKAQPGYYGELGSVIIHQTLYNMFPLSEIVPDLVAPLTASEFVQRILVPEVALRLIMEDRDFDSDSRKDIEEALEILRDSSSYGVAMFPEDGGEWGGNKKRGEEDKMGVGDMIVMERARKRRKELEEEEEDEMRLLEEKRQRGAEEKEKKGKKKRNPKQKTEPAGDSSEVNEPLERPRPRPRPITKDSSGTSVPTSQDLDQGYQSRSSRSRTRSRSRSVASDRRRPSSEERRRSPSASESRKPEDTSPALTTLAASRSMSVLSLDSDSDASNKAVVNTERRSRSTARLTSVRPKHVKISSDRVRIGKDDDSDDDEVEILDVLGEKTPVQKRRRDMEIDDEDKDTPKAAAARTASRSNVVFPLLATRLKYGFRKEQTGSAGLVTGRLSGARSMKPSKSSDRFTDNTMDPRYGSPDIDEPKTKAGPSTKQESNSWLLSQSSQSSLDDNRRKK